MEKIKHGQISAAVAQRYGSNAQGYDAVANGDAARERERAGRLMVAVPPHEGPVTQCVLKIAVAYNDNTTTGMREHFFETYSSAIGAVDFPAGTPAYDDATGQQFVFVSAVNPMLPVLRNLANGQLYSYDAKHERWVGSSAVPVSTPSLSSAARTMDTEMDEAPKMAPSTLSGLSALSTSTSSHATSAVNASSSASSTTATSTSSFSSSSNYATSSSSSSARVSVSADSESKATSIADSAKFVVDRKQLKNHIHHHYKDVLRGSTHSVFIDKTEVNGIIDAVVEKIKLTTAAWKTPSDKGRKVTLDIGRVIGFLGESLGAAQNYPTTSTVEAYYNFKYDANTGTRSIFLLTLYPCKEYNKGTLDQNGYKYVNGKAVPK